MIMNKEYEPLLPLRYKIIGASTEEFDCPVYSLLQLPERSQGWSSVRFCSYPQEILIQFTEPVRLCQINLLLHQSKIPNKIDIYHFFPKSYYDLFADYNTLTYEKIGYVIPDTNSKTEYKARELKKVFINDNCLYLKLVFHNNYTNIHNYFNQVALIHIECFGFYFTQQNISSLFPPINLKDSKTSINDLEQYVPLGKVDDIQLDEICQIKILELQEKHKAAVKDEDYDYAKLLNGYIERIRNLGGKMMNLNQIKLKALTVNDYDTAKVMKTEIDRIRGIIRDIEVKDNIVPDYEQRDNSNENDIVQGSGLGEGDNDNDNEGDANADDEGVGYEDDQQSGIGNKYEVMTIDKHQSKSKVIQKQKKEKDKIAQQSQLDSIRNYKKKKDDGKNNFQADEDGVLEYAEEV